MPRSMIFLVDSSSRDILKLADFGRKHSERRCLDNVTDIFIFLLMEVAHAPFFNFCSPAICNLFFVCHPILITPSFEKLGQVSSLNLISNLYF